MSYQSTQLVSSSSSYWAQFKEKQRWESVRDAEDRELMAFIRESIPAKYVVPTFKDAAQASLLNTFDPPPYRHMHTVIDFWSAAVAVPEKDATQICSIVCLINTKKKCGLYLLRNGEWIFFELELFMVQIIEQFYRRSLYPANHRGMRSMEMRRLCETDNNRSADSMLSQCIRKIRAFCNREGIPDLIVNCEGKKKCFQKF